MKIAIPMTEGQICLHFGHCQQFCFVETDDKNNIVSKAMVVPPPHEPGVLPKWLAENKVNVILAGGMGSRAQQLLNASNVKVQTGVDCSMSVEDAVKAYLGGNLVTGENACSH